MSVTTTTRSAESHANTSREVRLPSTARLGFARGSVELRQFFRNREAVVFNFGFPPLLLLLFGTIFDGSYDHPGVSASKVFTASMIAYGAVSTAFLTMGVGIAMDREDGTLKRLRGTPLPAASYFVGKLVLVGVATVAEVALLLTEGVLLFDMPLPQGPGRWLTLAWLLALSVVACTLLGIAASSMTRSARSAPAVLNVVVVVLQFTSGIFIHPITMLPSWMVTLSSLFPVKWMGQGFRSVLLPDSVTFMEAGGAWEHGRTAAVLAGWCVVGLLLCRATFRWTSRSHG